MVAHAEPPRRVDGRHVPQRLDVVARVDRVEQQLEPAVAARGRAHADVGERLARRDRADPTLPTGSPRAGRPRAGPPRAISSGRAEQLRRRPGGSAARPGGAAPGRRRARTAARRRPARSAASSAEHPRERGARRAAVRRSARSDVALPPTATTRAARGGCDAVEHVARPASRARSISPAVGGSERRHSSASSPDPTGERRAPRHLVGHRPDRPARTIRHRRPPPRAARTGTYPSVRAAPLKASRASSSADRIVTSIPHASRGRPTRAPRGSPARLTAAVATAADVAGAQIAGLPRAGRRPPRRPRRSSRRRSPRRGSGPAARG